MRGRVDIVPRDPTVQDLPKGFKRKPEFISTIEKEKDRLTIFGGFSRQQSLPSGEARRTTDVDVIVEPFPKIEKVYRTPKDKTKLSFNEQPNLGDLTPIRTTAKDRSQNINRLFQIARGNFLDLKPPKDLKQFPFIEKPVESKGKFRFTSPIEELRRTTSIAVEKRKKASQSLGDALDLAKNLIKEARLTPKKRAELQTKYEKTVSDINVFGMKERAERVKLTKDLRDQQRREFGLSKPKEKTKRSPSEIRQPKQNLFTSLIPARRGNGVRSSIPRLPGSDIFIPRPSDPIIPRPSDPVIPRPSDPPRPPPSDIPKKVPSETPPPPPPYIPRQPPFFVPLSFGGVGGFGGGGRTAGQKTKFKPSLGGLLLGFEQKAPEGAITGFETRGIPSTKRLGRLFGGQSSRIRQIVGRPVSVKQPFKKQRKQKKKKRRFFGFEVRR